MSWTDERVEVLKKLWAEGLSASQIAGRIGGVSRNAVIGKVHRLGLSGRATTSRMRSMRPRARVVAFPTRAPAVQYRTQGNVALKALLVAEPDAEPFVVGTAVIEDFPMPQAERVELLSLKDNMCRWPLGDPQDENFRFCGCRTGGSTYCEYHSRIAYQPVQRRRQPQLMLATA
jgi:GcrA cell cycle regulator